VAAALWEAMEPMPNIFQFRKHCCTQTKNISFEQAASVPSAGLTSLQIFKRLKLQPEQTIFITGAAGGVGSFLIKILLAHHIENFVITVGSEENKQMFLTLGLKEYQIINYKEDHLVENILKANHQKPLILELIWLAIIWPK
jgi:NADPH:quinone reductase-like Zn-dependent oxidoreductase